MSDKELSETNEEVEEVTDEVTEEESQPEAQPVDPRELLFQVFEQGARASEDWNKSQLRIQCLMALQQVPELADIPSELKAEIRTVLTNLLQAGQLQFGLQHVLYPMVKDLE